MTAKMLGICACNIRLRECSVVSSGALLVVDIVWMASIDLLCSGLCLLLVANPASGERSNKDSFPLGRHLRKHRSFSETCRRCNGRGLYEVIHYYDYLYIC